VKGFKKCCISYALEGLMLIYFGMAVKMKALTVKDCNNDTDW
jgi:hypothetical protein